jgi:hypothetical protein
MKMKQPVASSHIQTASFTRATNLVDQFIAEDSCIMTYYR